MKALSLLLDSRYNRPDGSPRVARVGLVVGKHKAQDTIDQMGRLGLHVSALWSVNIKHKKLGTGNKSE